MINTSLVSSEPSLNIRKTISASISIIFFVNIERLFFVNLRKLIVDIDRMFFSNKERMSDLDIANMLTFISEVCNLLIQRYISSKRLEIFRVNISLQTFMMQLFTVPFHRNNFDIKQICLITFVQLEQ